MEAVRYTLRKFRAYMPYVAIALLVRYGLDAAPLLAQGDWKGAVYSLLNLPFEASLLSSSGITFDKLATIWYLSALFIVMPLFVWLLLKCRESWPVWALLLPILYYGKCGVNVNRTPLNDMLRAFVGMSLGTGIYFVVRRVRTVKIGKLIRTVLTVVEIAALAVSVYITFGNKSFSDLLLYSFSILAILELSGKTWSAKIRGAWCDFLAKMSLPVCLFHWDVALIIQRFGISTEHKLVLYYVLTVCFAAMAVMAVEAVGKAILPRREEIASFDC